MAIGAAIGIGFLALETASIIRGVFQEDEEEAAARVLVNREVADRALIVNLLADAESDQQELLSVQRAEQAGESVSNIANLLDPQLMFRLSQELPALQQAAVRAGPSQAELAAALGLGL